LKGVVWVNTRVETEIHFFGVDVAVNFIDSERAL